MTNQTRRHPRLTQQARRLRRDRTDEEAILWWRLRERSFGVKWRRQAPIGPFVVDFVSFEARLAIEVDWVHHAEQVSDLSRDDWLFLQGFRVLRFWNAEAKHHIDDVLDAIEAAVDC